MCWVQPIKSRLGACVDVGKGLSGKALESLTLYRSNSKGSTFQHSQKTTKKPPRREHLLGLVLQKTPFAKGLRRLGTAEATLGRSCWEESCEVSVWATAEALGYGKVSVRWFWIDFSWKKKRKKRCLGISLNGISFHVDILQMFFTGLPGA